MVSVWRAVANADKNNVDMLDFGHNVIPAYLKADERVYTCEFEGYWKDVAQSDLLWEANMEYIGENNVLNSRDRSWKIYSKNLISHLTLSMAPQMLKKTR